MKAKYLLSILVVLLGFSIAIAPDPYTHLYMVDAFCDQTTDPEALICCEQYRDLMYAGAMLPDAMIKDYYNMGGLNYRKMHNWGNAIDLINRIQSNDIAGKCYSKSRIFHLVPDGVSHNKIVPDMMKAWMMPNELVHIPTEYAMGASVLKHSEENGIPKEQWFQKGTSSLNALFDEDYYRFVELEQVNMGVGSGVNMEERINSLIYFVGGNRFFEEGYTPSPQEVSRKLDVFWLFVGLVLLIPGLLLTKLAINRNKFVLVLSLPMIILGLLLLLGVGMAFVNKISVISYGWKFFYQTLGGLISKDEGELVGASLSIMNDLWKSPQGSKIIHYKGEIIDISSPHGFEALGYASGSTSFTRLIFWIISRFVILIVAVVGIRFLYNKFIKRGKKK